MKKEKKKKDNVFLETAREQFFLAAFLSARSLAKQIMGEL
jgi:hypothetical protein